MGKKDKNKGKKKDKAKGKGKLKASEQVLVDTPVDVDGPASPVVSSADKSSAGDATTAAQDQAPSPSDATGPAGAIPPSDAAALASVASPVDGAACEEPAFDGDGAASDSEFMRCQIKLERELAALERESYRHVDLDDEADDIEPAQAPASVQVEDPASTKAATCEPASASVLTVAPEASSSSAQSSAPAQYPAPMQYPASEADAPHKTDPETAASVIAAFRNAIGTPPKPDAADTAAAQASGADTVTAQASDAAVSPANAVFTPANATSVPASVGAPASAVSVPASVSASAATVSADAPVSNADVPAPPVEPGMVADGRTGAETSDAVPVAGSDGKGHKVKVLIIVLVVALAIIIGAIITFVMLKNRGESTAVQTDYLAASGATSDEVRYEAIGDTTVKVGDAVLYTDDDGDVCVNRVIAIAGQRVDVDSDGDIFVDGEVIDCPQVELTGRRSDGVTFPLVLTDGTCYVLGDGESTSLADRGSALIDVAQIIGTVPAYE